MPRENETDIKRNQEKTEEAVNEFIRLAGERCPDCAGTLLVDRDGGTVVCAGSYHVSVEEARRYIEPRLLVISEQVM